MFITPSCYRLYECDSLDSLYYQGRRVYLTVRLDSLNFENGSLKKSEAQMNPHRTRIKERGKKEGIESPRDT
jgi:hypothetical protein